MSDVHIDICEAIESTLCDGLGIEKDQHTYEVAVSIFDTVNLEFSKYFSQIPTVAIPGA